MVYKGYLSWHFYGCFMLLNHGWSSGFPLFPAARKRALLELLPARVPRIGLVHGVLPGEGCVEADPTEHHLQPWRDFVKHLRWFHGVTRCEATWCEGVLPGLLAGLLPGVHKVPTNGKVEGVHEHSAPLAKLPGTPQWFMISASNYGSHDYLVNKVASCETNSCVAH